MKAHAPQFLFLLLLLAPTAADAARAPIYKTTDERGNVVYTDDPRGRPAEAVDLPELTIVPAADLPAAPAATSAEEEEAMAPIAVELLTPEQEATVRSNTGDVEIRVDTSRPADDDYRFELLLDGEPRTRNRSGSFSLTGVDRGAHDVTVRLLDGGGKVIATSATHTFYLHQRSRLHP